MADHHHQQQQQQRAVLLLLLYYFSCFGRRYVYIPMAAAAQQQRPRGIIVIQPDDLSFMEHWTPSPHFPKQSSVLDGAIGLVPNMDRLRTNGLQMLRAYAASPWCGTSRYSTMTGRYPSRAASSRWYNAGIDVSSSSSLVMIDNTKLVDLVVVPNNNHAEHGGGGGGGDDVYYYNDDASDTTFRIEDGQDCSRSNIAQVLRSNGYRTGVIGKWHLSYDANSSSEGRFHYNYQETQERIRSCGFDTAEAIYHENMYNTDWTNNGAFTHNMEHLTIRAIEYMDSALDHDQDFFLYFNPTAPHDSGNVYEALTAYSCLDTVEGRLEQEPWIPGMTANIGCDAYRQSVLQRAKGDISNGVLGAIWVDDAVGALLLYLESRGILDSTLIVFQMDHGKEGKGSLYEPGLRIAQFVHYPLEIVPGSLYSGLVSTIDVAPTILDYAGIRNDDSSPGIYDMDGRSWRNLIDHRRCIVAEDGYDRAVVCDCDKYIKIENPSVSGTYHRGNQHGLINWDETIFFLCDRKSMYVTSPFDSREAIGMVSPSNDLVSMLDCHSAMTDPNQTPLYGICDDLLFPDLWLGAESAGTISTTSSSISSTSDNNRLVPQPLQPEPSEFTAASSSSSSSSAVPDESTDLIETGSNNVKISSAGYDTCSSFVPWVTARMTTTPLLVAVSLLLF